MTNEQRIEAINEVNRVGKIIYDSINPQLLTYLNKEIFLKNGFDFKKSFNVDIPEIKPLKGSFDLVRVKNVKLSVNSGNFWLEIFFEFRSNGIGYSRKFASVIGAVENRVLIRVNNLKLDPEVCNMDQELDKYSKILELEKQLNELKKKSILWYDLATYRY